jgi:hypothetical protein
MSFALDDLRERCLIRQIELPIALIAAGVRPIAAGLLLMRNARRPLLVPNLRLLLLENSAKRFAHVGLEARSVLKRRVEDRFHDDPPLR